MKVTCPFSCFLFLSFGACFPPDDGDISRYPTEECRVTEGRPGLCLPGAYPRWKRSPEDQRTLFNIARELQNFEKEKAGIRFRFGRQPGSQEEESEDANYLPEDLEGQKRSSTLGSLAEELNGYGREKGGFSFRFGRQRDARFPSRAD